MPEEQASAGTIGRYRGNSRDNSPSAPFVLESTAPKHARKTKFSAEIERVSPQFVEIYNQAMAAEGASLDQLVGMGLRKALEFLVKDFAISSAATEDEKKGITKNPLGRCIEDHIKDAAVRAAAKRATWLVNDETHYERRCADASDGGDSRSARRVRQGTAPGERRAANGEQ